MFFKAVFLFPFNVLFQICELQKNGVEEKGEEGLCRIFDFVYIFAHDLWNRLFPLPENQSLEKWRKLIINIKRKMEKTN